MYSQTRRTTEDNDVMTTHHTTRPSQPSSASSSHPLSALGNSSSADVVGGSVVGGSVVDEGGTSEPGTADDPMRCDALRNMNGLLTEQTHWGKKYNDSDGINGDASGLQMSRLG